MSMAAMAFLYLAIGASGGALAFLAGQRASGRTPPEVEACHEQAALLESVARDLDALEQEAARSDLPEADRAEIGQARTRLDDAIGGLRRGADLLV